MCMFYLFFFFQAEDGIRDLTVTGVQTCALPISLTPTDSLDDHLSRQLATLKSMFDQKKDDDFYANFDYVTQRTLFSMKNRRPSELGDIRIYTPREMLSSLFAKSNVPTTIDWSELE